MECLLIPGILESVVRDSKEKMTLVLSFTLILVRKTVVLVLSILFI